MRYVVVLEQTANNWGAYVPDLPGCVSTGATREEVEQNIREAVVGHLQVTLEYGEPIPAPGTWTTEVEVPDEVLQRAG